MIKHILVGLAASFLVACTQVNTNGDKTITQGDDTIAEVDISLSKMDAVEELSKIDEPKKDKILFKAGGTEPGWIVEISQLKIRLVVDYGKDSMITEYKGPTINRNEDFEYVINKIFSLIAENKHCVDGASGEKMDRQVSVSYKGKNYKGCGSFIK